MSVIVFSASWCQPCRPFKASLERAGIPFVVADIDSKHGGELADELGVASIPAAFLKTGGRYVRINNPSAAAVRAALQRHGE